MGRHLYYPHFLGEQTEAQAGAVTHSESYGQCEWELTQRSAPNPRGTGSGEPQPRASGGGGPSSHVTSGGGGVWGGLPEGVLGEGAGGRHPLPDDTDPFLSAHSTFHIRI